MIIYKTSILFLLLILSFFQPADKNFPDSEKNKLRQADGVSLSDSISQSLTTNSWNAEFLKSYQRIILNSDINLLQQKQKAEKLSDGFEKSFILAMIFKREGNYEQMFATLYSHLSSHLGFLSYYEELIFSASATDRLAVLDAKLNGDKSFEESFDKNILLYFINSSRGEYKEAEKYITPLVKKDSYNYDLLYHYSYLFRNLGDYQQAMSELNNALKIANQDKWFQIKATLAKGSLYFLSGENEKALIEYDSALKLSRSVGDKQNEAKALVNIGIIHDMNGEVKKARDYFSKSLNISKKINDKENQAFAYSELGVSLSFTNELILSKNNYMQSYEIYKDLGNKMRLSFLSNNIGKIYLNIFDFKSALNYYNDGVDFAADNKRALALNLTGIADVYANLSNYSEALKYYRKAQEIASEIKELELSSQLNSGLGILNFNLERFSNSLQYFEKAFLESEEAGNPYSTADIYNKIGISFFKLDSLEKAKSFLLKSLELSKEIHSFYTETLSSLDLAVLYFKMNNSKEARKYLSESKSSAVKYGLENILSEVLIVEGNLYSKETDFNSARSSYLSSLKISRELNEYNLQIEALHSLGKLFAKNNLDAAAESYFKSAFDLIEDISRPMFEEDVVQIFYFSSKAEVYNSYANLLLKQKKFTEAFELIDRSRARNTMQNLTNLKLQTEVGSNVLVEKIYEYEWLIHSQILSEKELDSVKIEYQILKKELVSANPSLARYLNFNSSRSVKNMQQSLSGKENFISIYTTKESTHIFLIDKKEFQHFEIAKGQKDILSMLSAISPFYDDSFSGHEFYNQDLFSFNSKSAFDFYSAILKPVLAKVKKDEKIILSPSTELIVFPFEFLVTSFDENSSPYSYNDKEFLIYDYNISYANSAANYLELKESGNTISSKSLIVGNPFINSGTNDFADRRGLLEENSGVPRNIALLPLKYSEEEINGVGSLIGTNQVLVNTDATETNFKHNCENNKVIHLSTHSMLINKQPVIFFSNSYDTENDGFLEASEIVQLKLNSDLVVLSSCNSGLGAIDASEGILGMSKAFFESGSKSIVVSLWEVNDKYTSKFMLLFYKRLSEGFDKSEAIRFAKLDFIKEYSPNPFYWSAFILNGNITKIELKQNVNMLPYIIGLLAIITASILFVYWRRKQKLSTA